MLTPCINTQQLSFVIKLKLLSWYNTRVGYILFAEARYVLHYVLTIGTEGCYVVTCRRRVIKKGSLAGS